MVISATARAAKALALRNLRKLRIKKKQTQKPRRMRVKLPPKVGSVTQKKAEARAMGRIRKKYGLQGIKITPDIVRRIAREEALTRHLERKHGSVPKLASLAGRIARAKAVTEAKAKAKAFNKKYDKYGGKKVYGIGSAFNRKVAKDKFIKKNILDKDKADILKGILPSASFKAKSFGNWPRRYTGGPGRPGGGPPKKPKKDGLAFGFGKDRMPKKRRNLLDRKYAPWFAAGGFGTALGVRGYIDYHEEQKKKKNL